MIVTISPTQIKEIAGELDAGMKCFYHIPAGEVKLKFKAGRFF